MNDKETSTVAEPAEGSEAVFSFVKTDEGNPFRARDLDDAYRAERVLTWEEFSEAIAVQHGYTVEELRADGWMLTRDYAWCRPEWNGSEGYANLLDTETEASAMWGDWKLAANEIATAVAILEETPGKVVYTPGMWPGHRGDGPMGLHVAVEEIESAIAADEEPIAEATEKRRTLVGYMFVPASEIQARKQRWLWDGRIPFALPTLLVGMQGLGKSQFTLWLTARVSTGQIGGDPGTVLVLSAEDDPNTTIIPRLMAVGADLDRVRIHRVDRSLSFPKDIALLDEAVEEYAATFVVVDPIMAYLDPTVDAYKATDVRGTLRGIYGVCQDRRVTVLPLMHFRKESANEVLHMVTSSSAFTEGPRSVLGLGKQPDAPEGQLALVHLKCNVGPKQPSLEVTIEPTIVMGEDGEAIPTSYAKVGGALDPSARDVFQPKQGRPSDTRAEAKGFLTEWLARPDAVHTVGKSTVRRIPVVTVRKAWRAAGLGSKDTLDRARADLGLKAVSDDGEWFWTEEF